MSAQMFGATLAAAANRVLFSEGIAAAETAAKVVRGR
jgi:hypothetical protein